KRDWSSDVCSSDLSLDSSASERLRHRQQRTVRGPLMSVTDTTPELTIDADRLWSDLMELAAIGAYDDEATGLVGVNRQSLTDEDRAGRELLLSWMEELDLGITVDEMGTIVGRTAGQGPGLAPVPAG